MVAYAFYHNVENYSTSHAVAAALGNGYQGVRNVMAAGPIVVAGFSEILSPSAGPALAPAVTQLDPQLQMFAVVNIGIMLGREEYLAIAVSRPSPPIGAARPVAFNPLEIGRLVFHRTPHGGMTLVLDPWVHQGLGPPVLQPLPWPAGGAPGWANGLPYARHPPLPANDPWSRREPDEADYRGFVYIIGWIGPSVHDNARMPSAPEPPLHGVQGIVPRRPVIGAAPPPPAPPSGPARAGYQVVAVVFTHNRYKEAASTKGGGRRYRSAENVVTMANVPKVYERLFAHRYAPSCVYVGADWNQAPIVAREEWLQPIAAQPAAPAAPGPGGWPPPPPPGTTKFGGHHLYDWWFAAGNHRFPIPAGQQPASVLPDPLVTPAGAAAGVQAQIPWPVPTAYTEATGPTTSDHAAIALQIQ